MNLSDWARKFINKPETDLELQIREIKDTVRILNIQLMTISKIKGVNFSFRCGRNSENWIGYYGWNWQPLVFNATESVSRTL